MTYSNFTNGALVLRVWHFEGDSEVISKHQYMADAEMFAKMLFERDYKRAQDVNDVLSYFYLAVCEYECRAKAFGVRKEEK